jgi:hypothetical protein
MRYAGRYRSLLWPAVLIFAGIFALLVNTGTIPVDRLYQLFDLWPLILIVIGLELIIRRSVRGPTGGVAGVLVAVLALGGAVAYVVAGPNPTTSKTLDTFSPMGTIAQASLEVDAGSANITVSGSNSVGNHLYEAHIEYTGPKPQVSLDSSSGLVRISQASTNFPFFQTRKFVLDIKLNPELPWSITENSGATTDSLNLADVKVGSIVLNTGASREEITVGEPSGLVPVTINGGSLTVHIHRPKGTMASVAVAGGAVSLNADGKQMRAIGDLTFQSPGFSTEADAYRIQINGGACNVTLDTTR